MKIPDLHESDILLLETEMDNMNEMLPELKHFVLPGGNTVVSIATWHGVFAGAPNVWRFTWQQRVLLTKK